MAIEVKCTGCGNTLRVGDEHVGKEAKCPVCESVFVVPDPRQVSTASDPPPVSSKPQPGQFTDDNPYHPPSAPSTGGTGLMTMKPHRGGLVLTLGIVSILCCNLLGIAAWVMGNEDLTQMDRGQMDPSGRGLTQAGKVCGIVALVLMVVGIAFQVVMLAARG